MEQKRTLWIIAAVGVFLLVVLGAALILYAPAARTTQSVASSRGMDNGTASNGWISLAPSAPNPNGKPYDFTGDEPANDGFNFDSLEAPSEGAEFRTDEVNIYAENANLYTENTTINSLGKTAAASEAVSSSKPVSTTIDLTTSTLAAGSAPKATAASSGTLAKAEPVKSVSVKPAAKAAAPKTAPAKASSAKEVSKPASVKVASTGTTAKPAQTITQYWIQVTALTSRKSADAAREVLGKNQITADVFTYKDNKDQLFYRVRVGPYTTKSEAEYWRTKIAKIENFANTASYVTSTQVAK